MTELTIKVIVKNHIDTIGIKENIATTLEEIHGVMSVKVVDVQERNISE